MTVDEKAATILFVARKGNGAKLSQLGRTKNATNETQLQIENTRVNDAEINAESFQSVPSLRGNFRICSLTTFFKMLKYFI